MPSRRGDIPELFRSRFTVDYAAPFQRHLNRLEVEIGREDYRHLKKVELLATLPDEEAFAAMEEITGRVLETTQNNYNRDLLQHLGIRVYLDPLRYAVYYRLAQRAVRFTAAWRQKVLLRFFPRLPLADSGWQPAGPRLAGFEVRYLPDQAGGALLLRQATAVSGGTLLTATHGPYDPHSFDVALYLLRTGCGEAALVNLGFSGREPLTDDNLERLKKWGIPLNPSNIDVIYPYVDATGHPYCYKLEERLAHYVSLLGREAPQLIVDLHGCVGTRPEEERLIVGLGGAPPFPELAALGRLESEDGRTTLLPSPLLRQGLALLSGISTEVCLQFCLSPEICYHFRLASGARLPGRAVVPQRDARSLITGEPRHYLPAEQVRWLPGARGNALQREAAGALHADLLCLHVEMPTATRRRLALAL